jgi:hypothetical protein
VEEKNKGDENEDMVPSFAETYEALEKVKAFFYAHSVTDANRERILGLEKSYFQLKQNSAMKQKDNVQLFSLKKVVFQIFRLFSPLPSKTKNREFTVIIQIPHCCIVNLTPVALSGLSGLNKK